MIKKAFFLFGLVGVATVCSPAYADSYLLHLEGEVGDRRAYFADMLVTDRTAPTLEPQPTEIKELQVTIIYENAQMPELVEFNLQFECTNEFYYAYHKNKQKPPKVSQWDPVKTRVAAESVILRRIDLKTEPVPAGEWQVSTELAMLKAHQLACNHQKIENVVRSSMVGDQFHRKTFEEKFPALGLETLTKGILVTPLVLWTEYIDLTFKTLWPDAKHPDPSGKWSRDSTPDEIAEFERKFTSAKQQLAELSDKTKRAYEPKVEEMQYRLAFDVAAKELRGGRKLRDFEAKMLQVWQGKSEDVVIASMGQPRFANTGRLHTLSFNQVFDNRVTVGSSDGAVWTEGKYTNCDVQFVTIADGGGAYRVADIVLNIDSTDIMATNFNDACGYLKVVPQD